MRRFRVFLLFVLSVALPLQGYAYFAAPHVPCPMTEMGEMAHEDSPAMAHADSAMHDCCNDADTAEKTGKPCKPAQPCSSAGQFLPFSNLAVIPQERAPSVRFPHLADIAISFDPAATWRPPAQL